MGSRDIASKSNEFASSGGTDGFRRRKQIRRVRQPGGKSVNSLPYTPRKPSDITYMSQLEV
jgi:hypothetical protein